MQVNPVMILVEMKSLEGNNRILRNQCESDSVPLTMSFEQTEKPLKFLIILVEKFILK